MRKKGFTLIELLIVVAIIAILAAIAVPNFLEAQMRARVSRVKADLRTVKTGLEQYFVDHNAFPHMASQAAGKQNNRGGIHMVTNLSTPVAYLMTVDLPDPFAPNAERDALGNLLGMTDPNSPGSEYPYSLGYVNIKLMQLQGQSPHRFSQPAYVVLSLGPDYVRGSIDKRWLYGSYANEPAKHDYYKDMEYDSSNGTKSGGDILSWP